MLRPFRMDDADTVQTYAGDRAVAATTVRIPHPYPEGEAVRWIETHPERFESGRGLPLAITLRGENDVIGAIGLEIDQAFRNAELGYWIARPHWGNGYATEAAEAVLDYGFRSLDLHRIHAHFMAGNPASGRVLEKIGMTREGCLRQHVLKWGAFVDAVIYGCLREEWEDAAPRGPAER